LLDLPVFEFVEQVAFAAEMVAFAVAQMWSQMKVVASGMADLSYFA